MIGDRAQIEASLRELPEGQRMSICRFDDQFKLSPVQP